MCFMEFKPSLLGWFAIAIIIVFILLLVFGYGEIATLLAGFLGSVFVIFMILKIIWNAISGKKEKKEKK